MRIAVVGSGYVGLVAATCFAETGNEVVTVDRDRSKIDLLNSGGIPIYEPGLEEMVQRNRAEGRLVFTTDLPGAVRSCRIIFIAVGTPPDEDGSADLKHVLAVAREIGENIDGPRIVVNKSTVPVGTADLVRAEIKKYTTHEVSVVSNPEFLKEGTAIDDFLKPDRVVIGTSDPAAAVTMREIYSPFVRTNNPVIVMSNRSAEMTKYVANSLLAARISFMNEVANLCDAMGADVDEVRIGVGSDRRIGPSFLFPGVGFGGSCFPKDVRALMATARGQGMRMHTLEAAVEVNEAQKRKMLEKLEAVFGPSLRGLRMAVWGLAFKPNTDDMREAPSVVVIKGLLERGARVAVYDPQAMKNARTILGETVEYCRSGYEAAEGADALILLTEWLEFREPDFSKLASTMRRKAVFDGRNVWNPSKLKGLGFEYCGMGRR
ncbi:MAG TPA: UDP-glucose/GDP-mannose dehydrogenase family protein [Candidatus Fermentibacter daniensis]|jgi:UDPglucose 6-dehydrogenase|nr:UDP-glucose/GDP-mannose dehydrogenase family protein [Candidatus Fermentibacter sp.]HOD19987.1 UDP-glucose/GDP-mannose dehydrogenase family protein [Candidatus Fermentibacter daniensis]HQM41833.1 UDP-glucose/GDP-mannose dehydrogenase family protein [Candidatus Fermentibacter daniensis]